MEMIPTWKIGIDVRRGLASNSGESTKWDCRVCGKRHDNYHSHVEHEMCWKCREAEFDKARLSHKCPRCNSDLTKLKPNRPVAVDYLVCLTCALLLPALRIEASKPQEAPQPSIDEAS